MFRAIVETNRSLSKWFDRLLPKKFQIDGNRDFRHRVVPPLLKKGMTVYDIGSGRHPFVDPVLKTELNLTVIGVDIDDDELCAAPAGSYDEILVADVTKPLDHINREGLLSGGGADILICQSVLEHLPDNRSAFRGFEQLLRPGGLLVTFNPSKHAAFAKINLLLPEKFKKKLLISLYPETITGYGFQAHYDCCTISELCEIADKSGLDVIEAIPYYKSSYFHFFAPLHIVWRMWSVAFAALAGTRGAETMTLIFQKPQPK